MGMAIGPVVRRLLPAGRAEPVLAAFDPGTQRAILRLYRASPPSALEPLAAPLREMNRPTLVVWGADDPLLSPALGPVFAEQIPDARLVILPECGHIPMLESPDALHREVLGFLG